jgi:DMSO/TMAO reductase YedYZ molybdopterin-dependent catalytic subunit
MFSEADRLQHLTAFEQLTAKQVRTREAWARDGGAGDKRRLDKKGLRTPVDGPAARRLPPGQTLVRGRAPVVDLGTTPRVAPRDWRLEISGAVRRPARWSLEELAGAPRETMVSDIHCVTRWSRFGNRWGGVPVRHLLEVAGPTGDARFAMIKSHDGYSTNLPVEVLLRDDVLLATDWDGAPLSPEHGAPARLVVPHLYFWKSAKWVRSIRLTSDDAPGFWESRGYHNEGDPWREQRYR